MSFLKAWCWLTNTAITVYGQSRTGLFFFNLFLWSKRERRAYVIRTTQGWVNDDTVLGELSQKKNQYFQLTVVCFLKLLKTVVLTGDGFMSFISWTVCSWWTSSHKSHLWVLALEELWTSPWSSHRILLMERLASPVIRQWWRWNQKIQTSAWYKTLSWAFFSLYISKF